MPTKFKFNGLRMRRVNSPPVSVVVWVNPDVRARKRSLVDTHSFENPHVLKPSHGQLQRPSVRRRTQ